MPNRTTSRRRIRATAVMAMWVLLATAAACGSDAAAPNAADRTFLQEMIPHHERAIEVARLGVTGATDPRVRAFAARIVREQTPELTRMRDAAAGQRLDLTHGARAARHRISDADLTALQSLRGTAFDRRFVQLHIMSETGAAEMARTELDDGDDATARAVARPIATAPDTQIPELRALLAALGR